MRGMLHEFGITIPVDAGKVRPAVLAALEDADNDLPMALREIRPALQSQRCTASTVSVGLVLKHSLA